MRMLHSSVVGIPSKSAWSTTVAWHFDSAQVYGALSFSGDEQSPHLGRRLIAEVSEQRNQPIEHFYRFLSEKIAEYSSGTTVSAALIWCEGTTLSILCFGHARVALQRKLGVWRWLCDGSQESQVLQGTIQAGDLFVLLTAASYQLAGFPSEPLTDPEIGTMTLMPMVQRLADQSEVSVQIVQAEPAQSVSKDSTRVVIPQEAESRSEVSSEQPAMGINNTNPSSGTPSHLISPAKLSQGIAAAQVSTPRHHRLPQWWRFFRWERRQALPQLHLWRIAAVIVIVVAVAGGLVGMRSMRVRSERAQVVVPLQELTAQLRAIPDEDRFTQRDAAKSLLERLQATQVSYRSNQREVQSLIVQVQSIYDHTAAETNLVNLPIYFDFRLVDPTFLANRVSREQETALFVDTSQNKALKLDLPSKRSERVESAGITDIRDVAMSASQVFWTTATQVIRTTSAGTEPTVLTTWTEGRDPQRAERYADTLYVLDSAAQQLWRVDTQTAASPSGWIRSARGVDVSQISSLTIDGEVWMGSSQGDVYRLARGERQDFAISGLQEPLSSSVLLATTPEGTTLAIVEPARQRIVFVNKQTGEYLRQVSSPQIGAVTDVFWGPGETSLYLLAGSVIYRVEN